tara:strand:- start:1582 stop:1758 length:177 start_codon:yes stop_codon:yes gene_type:complete
MAEKDKVMDEKKLTKAQKKQIRKEKREHNKAARKTYREDHPIGWRLKNLVKKIIRKNK